LLLWKIFGDDPEIPGWAFPAALAFSIFYYPMAFLTVTMFDSVAGINPMAVVPAMVKMPLQYLVACFVMGVVVLVYWAGSYALPALIPIPVVPGLIAHLFSTYLFTVLCRILGLLYYTNRHELGWFAHR
jgi:hypothetical protein